MKQNYLTKSRFKLARECPTKLFYTGKKSYANRKHDNPFLEALAEGGFQIGELAKAYYPEGQDIKSLQIKEALEETNRYLESDTCTIFEAAIKHHNLFIRVDLLIKEGNQIQLIEVKSKSIDKKIKQLSKGEGKITKTWAPYIEDIAFQYYVARQAFPNYQITPYLMLLDPEIPCPSDELYQKIKLEKDDSGRLLVRLVEDLTMAEREGALLSLIPAEKMCEKVIDDTLYEFQGEKISFAELVKRYAGAYEADERIQANISLACKNCEFKADDNQLAAGMACGYRECFTRMKGWEEADFAEDTIFDLWHVLKADTLIANNKLKFSELTEKDIPLIPQKVGLSRSERQWLQIKKSVEKDSSYYLDREGLKAEMDQWTFPYHFIDFETTLPMIPFNKGRRPNETIAFQFSHHLVHEDGRVVHQTEFLHTEIGVNPNIAFVRALKQALEKDEGTIFRYHYHENTVLNSIYHELQEDPNPVADREELCQFIRSITQYRDKKKLIAGPRNMVDLHRLVQDYYYDPATKGSISIKDVLPAIINSSSYLQEKYSQPIYGADAEIKSLNFPSQVWIQREGDRFIDPYQLLPKLFDDLSEEEYEDIQIQAELNNGGAAMVAYERLQHEDIAPKVREKIEAGMLKYCELDTLAMVFIYEAWLDMIQKDK